MTMPDLSPVLNAKPFKGNLFPKQASEAIDAAYHTAQSLLDTAELLHEHGRFAHCVSMSILAMEEAGKRAIILKMMLGYADIGLGWKDYVRHLAKTENINDAIAMQIRNYFPEMPREVAEALGRAGPNADTLEKTKQRAVYSDCLDKKGKCEIHDPSTVDWKEVAWFVLCDARVIVSTLRHYSPTELTIWLEHGKLCQKEGRGWETGLVTLEKELRDAGFIQSGWWKQILEMAPPSGEAGSQS